MPPAAGADLAADFIVVGAGSAGCAVAARLSESGRHRVLLLEAGGPDDHEDVHIPARFTNLLGSEMDWAYLTVPQPGLNGRRDSVPRGKLYGGSSAINSMVYQRGNPANYEHWAALGNAGWRYAELLPWFRHMQHQARGASAQHGVGGPVHVSDLRDPNPLSLAFVAAAQQAGLRQGAEGTGILGDEEVRRAVRAFLEDLGCQRGGAAVEHGQLKPADFAEALQQRADQAFVAAGIDGERLLCGQRRRQGRQESGQGAKGDEGAAHGLLLCFGRSGALPSRLYGLFSVGADPPIAVPALDDCASFGKSTAPVHVNSQPADIAGRQLRLNRAGGAFCAWLTFHRHDGASLAGRRCGTMPVTRRGERGQRTASERGRGVRAG